MRVPSCGVLLLCVGLAHAQAPPPDRTGTLSVTIIFDGKGSWRHASNGAYANLTFARQLSYAMTLRGTYLPGEPAGLAPPDLRRYLVAQSAEAMGPAGTPCGRGGASILDKSSGMEVGDPGQPPLVPFTQQIRGGGPYPSADRSVPERDLCLTRVTFDNEKHRLKLELDGTDALVKVANIHNRHKSPAYNLRLQGDSADAKSHFTFELPIPAGALKAEGVKRIANVSTISGPDHSVFPLHATVKWRVEMK